MFLRCRTFTFLKYFFPVIRTVPDRDPRSQQRLLAGWDRPPHPGEEEGAAAVLHPLEREEPPRRGGPEPDQAGWDT